MFKNSWKNWGKKRKLSSFFDLSFVKFLICLWMHKFAFLKTWPYSKDIYEKGHVLRNANFCIPREIKNFTRNDSPNLLLVNIVVNVKGQPHVHRNCRSVIERLSLRTLYLSEPQHQWRIIACRRWTENAILQQKKNQNNNIDKQQICHFTCNS